MNSHINSEDASKSEEKLLDLIGQTSCSENQKRIIIKNLLDNVINGIAEDKTVDWFCCMIREKDPFIQKLMLDVNNKIYSDEEYPWYHRKSLSDLYIKICKSKKIHMENCVKISSLDIIGKWYLRHLKNQDYSSCYRFLLPLVEVLDQPGITDIRRKEIYDDMLHLLFLSDRKVRENISVLIKNEEYKIAGNRQQAQFFRECFGRQLDQKDCALNEDVMWHISYWVVLNDQAFLYNEWKVFYADLLARFVSTQSNLVCDKIQIYFREWMENAFDENEQELVGRALTLVLEMGLQDGKPYYRPTMPALRKSLSVLEDGNMSAAVIEILYMRYQLESRKTENEKYAFLTHELDKTEVLKILGKWMLTESEDRVLYRYMQTDLEDRNDLLPGFTKMNLQNPKDISRLANCYFNLMKQQVNNQISPNPLKIWCDIYRADEEEIIANVDYAGFVEEIRRNILSELAETDPNGLPALSRKDLRLLTSLGCASLGPAWECLDIINIIYSMDESQVPDEFLELRARIIQERNAELKNLYMRSLADRRTMLSVSENEKKYRDLLYHITLLEYQIRQDVENISFNIETCKNMIYRSDEEKSAYVAMRLLNLVNQYANCNDYGVYDILNFQRSLIDELRMLSEKKVGQFQDKSVGKAYKYLQSEQKNLLIEEGIINNLRSLPKEVRNTYYGLQESREPKSTRISRIFSVFEKSKKQKKD